MAARHPYDHFEILSSSVARHLSGKEDGRLPKDFILKISPFAISCLFSLFSALISSSIYAATMFLGSLTIMIFFAISTLLLLTISVSVITRGNELSGFRFRKFNKNSKEARYLRRVLNGENTIRMKSQKSNAEENPPDNEIFYSLEPLYEKNWIRGIRRTFVELSPMVSVMFLPGGIFDIIDGLTFESYGLANTANQIMLGIVVTAISVGFLLPAIVNEIRNSKHKMDINEHRIEKIMKMAREQLLSEHVVEIRFKPNED